MLRYSPSCALAGLILSLSSCGNPVNSCGDFVAVFPDEDAEEVVDAAEEEGVPVELPTDGEDTFEDTDTKEVTVVGCGGSIVSNDDVEAHGDGDGTNTVEIKVLMLDVIRSGDAELVRLR